MKSPRRAPLEPKYQRIANVLQEKIRKSMKTGAMLPSEGTLARKMKVNVLTIREALRVLRERGIIQRQRAVGTRVVNPLGGKWVTILCEMDVFAPTSHSLFHRGVIYHLRHLLREAGIPSRVSVGESQPGGQSKRQLTSQDFVADIEASRLAGVIALATIPAPWWLDKLKKQGVPVIGTNAQFPHHLAHDVRSDLGRAVRRFLESGRRRIAYIGWMEKIAGVPADERVLLAIESIEKQYAVTIRKEWIKGDIYPERAGAGWEEFREIWTSSREKPNALIVDNEHLLPDVERGLSELGLEVPRDLLVIAHRTRGNEHAPRYPVIFLESDAEIYARRMAEGFLRLYRGEEWTGPLLISRTMTDDVAGTGPGSARPPFSSGKSPARAKPTKRPAA